MDTAEKLLRNVVETLDLCRPCRSKLLNQGDTGGADDGSARDSGYISANEHRDATPQQPESHTAPDPPTSTFEFEIEYDDSTVSKVRFNNTALGNVQVKHCKWQNVTFTNCKLNDVVFHSLELTNVHFYDTDFDNVTLRDLQLQDVDWSHQYLAHASLSTESYRTRIGRPTELVFSVLGRSGISRTKGGHKAKRRGASLAYEHLHDRDGLKKIALTGTTPKAFMSLPEAVLRKIAAHLLPCTPIKIVDWPRGATGRRPTGQRQFSYKSGDRKDEQLTYVAWNNGKSSTNFCGDIKDAPKTGLSVAFLKVNRQLYKIGVSLLYQRQFIFRMDTLACLAFLHDHQKTEHAVKKIGFIMAPITGSNRDFEKLINVLIFERRDLEEVTVTVQPAFWQSVRWKSSAYDAESTCGIAKTSPILTSFLGQLARLPKRHGGHNLSVSLTIGLSRGSAARTKYVDDLRDGTLTIRSAQVPTQPRERCGCGCATDRNACPYEQTTTLLKLPENVLERIMQYIIPIGQVTVTEAPGQTHVRLGRQTNFPRKHHWSSRTTYLAAKTSLSDEARPIPQPDLLKTGICTAFLRLNRECYELGTSFLYSRGVHFDASPAVCLAFLHDHQRAEHKIENITIRYDEKSKCDMWRRLFNVIVHSRPDLRSLTVKVGSKFWEEAPWDKRRRPAFSSIASYVLDWEGWCSGSCCDERTFLRHISRLPLPKDNEGVRVDLQIEGAGNDQARLDFVKELRLEIGKLRAARPYAAVAEHRVCAKRTLEQSCYWSENISCGRVKVAQLMPGAKVGN